LVICTISDIFTDKNDNCSVSNVRYVHGGYTHQLKISLSILTISDYVEAIRVKLEKPDNWDKSNRIWILNADKSKAEFKVQKELLLRLFINFVR